MNELENKLNKLIELGWKPFGSKYLTFCEQIGPDGVMFQNSKGNIKSLNDLVSIDSGLWTFVCEKDLYKGFGDEYIDDTYLEYVGYDEKYYRKDPKYRLMFSAQHLDKTWFLLDNIKLEE